VPRQPTVEVSRPAVTAPVGTPIPGVRVAVTANPPEARFALDGTEVATGHIDEEVSGGTEHRLTVSAPGYRPERFVFRDHPPPETVRLERLPPDPNTIPTPPVDQAKSWTRGQGERLLIVDDERFLMLLAEEMLAALCYEPAGFTSADQALQEYLADPHRFDIRRANTATVVDLFIETISADY